MNIEKQLQDLNVNFDGKIAIYYDDLNGNNWLFWKIWYNYES